MAIDKYALFEQGIYIEKMTSPEKLSALITSLFPVRTNHELVRIGAENDGGYLLPNDLQDILACFSPGVDVNASFEIDLYKTKGINSHLADYSVSGPPMQFNPLSFTKRYLGCVNDETHITIDSWVSRQKEYSQLGDLLLQMDIEGHEYLSLLGASEELLKRFRIIVIEIHDVESWGQPVFFHCVDTFFQKLLKNFHVVHNHPNNCCGLVNLGGVVAPRVFELTLLRKDRAIVEGFCKTFPHNLDRANLVERGDLILPTNWYQQ
jgi:hypothetical protein